MSELTVQPETCNRCGLCVSVCPCGVITLENGATPRFTGEEAAGCIVCGHCEAVCPAGALTVRDMRLAPASPAPSLAEIDPELLGGYLRMRRSVRRYRKESVERNVIVELMDVVRFAPTGQNRQDVRWLIVHETAELRRLTGIAVDWMREEVASASPLAENFHLAARIRAWEQGRDAVCRQAPHLALAYVHQGNPRARTDALIALTHLDIVAPSFGLGTCWGGIFLMALNHHQPLREQLGLPAEHLPVHVLMLGYPEVSYSRPPKRHPSDVVWL